jgi:hypothetical protein
MLDYIKQTELINKINQKVSKLEIELKKIEKKEKDALINIRPITFFLYDEEPIKKSKIQALKRLKAGLELQSDQFNQEKLDEIKEKYQAPRFSLFKGYQHPILNGQTLHLFNEVETALRENSNNPNEFKVPKKT